MEEIKKIDMCEICFEKKAEYSYYKQVDTMLLGSRIWRALICRHCMKKIRTGEIRI